MLGLARLAAEERVVLGVLTLVAVLAAEETATHARGRPRLLHHRQRLVHVVLAEPVPRVVAARDVLVRTLLGTRTAHHAHVRLQRADGVSQAHAAVEEVQLRPHLVTADRSLNLGGRIVGLLHLLAGCLAVRLEDTVNVAAEPLALTLLRSQAGHAGEDVTPRQLGVGQRLLQLGLLGQPVGLQAPVTRARTQLSVQRQPLVLQIGAILLRLVHHVAPRSERDVTLRLCLAWHRGHSPAGLNDVEPGHHCNGWLLELPA